MVVLDKRFLKRSRPRKILRVAEMRVVVCGASVVLVLLLRLNRERLRKSRDRLIEDVEDSGSDSESGDLNLKNNIIVL